MAEVFRPTFNDPHRAEREALLKGFKNAEDPTLRDVYEFCTKNRHHPASVRETIHAALLAKSDLLHSNPSASSSIPSSVQVVREACFGALKNDSERAIPIKPESQARPVSAATQTHVAG